MGLFPEVGRWAKEIRHCKQHKIWIGELLPVGVQLGEPPQSMKANAIAEQSMAKKLQVKKAAKTSSAVWWGKPYVD